jgi:hypothetical protein
MTCAVFRRVHVSYIKSDTVGAPWVVAELDPLSIPLASEPICYCIAVLVRRSEILSRVPSLLPSGIQEHRNLNLARLSSCFVVASIGVTRCHIDFAVD